MDQTAKLEITNISLLELLLKLIQQQLTAEAFLLPSVICGAAAL